LKRDAEFEAPLIVRVMPGRSVSRAGLTSAVEQSSARVKDAPPRPRAEALSNPKLFQVRRGDGGESGQSRYKGKDAGSNPDFFHLKNNFTNSPRVFIAPRH
jgi:hypothetical protein